MSQRRYTFTSESVSEGHPDKLCDCIADAILDMFIALDPEARVAAEVFATANRVVVGGEVNLSNKDRQHAGIRYIETLVRKCICEIGYEQEKFHWLTCQVTNLMHQQSDDIAIGVDAATAKEEGAGDQGMMFGYATDETDAFMPAPIQYAHSILRRIAEARKAWKEPELGPDAKSQLSVVYENGKPSHLSSIVLSTQHLNPDLSSTDIREIVEPYVREVLPDNWINAATQWHVNPTGKFVNGGPSADAGLTGRKIIVDTYGGAAPHGGGAFSGKDPTKVDRSAAYAARYLAKNIVAAELANRCTLQLSYAIGVSRPLSIFVNTHGTGVVPEDQIERAVCEVMDLSPRGIREHLNLNWPIFRRTAAYGHFGREPTPDGGFSWEKTDLVAALKSAI